MKSYNSNTKSKISISCYKICFAFLFVLFAIHYSAFSFTCDVKGIQKDAPSLCGNAVQGGFLFGETDWNVTSSDGIVLDDNGIFVIGFPMDFKNTLRLKFCKDNKCFDYDYKIKKQNYKKQNITVDDEFIIYPPDIQKRIDNENENIMSVLSKPDFSSANFMDWKYPFKKIYPVSGNYGNRRIFNGIPKSPHKGFDIAASSGASIHSVGVGQVVLVLDGYLVGKTVVISHGYGIFSVYMHLSKIKVKKDDFVNFDTIIGNVGATGRVSGPHLHLGLYFGKTPIDGELLFNQK